MIVGARVLNDNSRLRFRHYDDTETRKHSNIPLENSRGRRSLPAAKIAAQNKACRGVSTLPLAPRPSPPSSHSSLFRVFYSLNSLFDGVFGERGISDGEVISFAL